MVNIRRFVLVLAVFCAFAIEAKNFRKNLKKNRNRKVETEAINSGHGSLWWRLAYLNGPESNEIDDMVINQNKIVKSLHFRKALTRQQQRLVRKHPGLLEAVTRGLRMAISECKYQFRDRRWNCPTSDFLASKSTFGPIVQKGSPEVAFFSALASAGVMREVAVECSQGNMPDCLKYDTRDKMESGLLIARRFLKEELDVDPANPNAIKSHNMKVGIRVFKNKLVETKCDCSNTIGRCITDNCVMVIRQDLRIVGNELKKLYLDAVQSVKARRIRPVSNDASAASKQPQRRMARSINSLPSQDPREKLVYVEKTDYCELRTTDNRYVTTGLECSVDPGSSTECRRYCCGGQYHQVVENSKAGCKCKTFWRTTRCDKCKLKSTWICK